MTYKIIRFYQDPDLDPVLLEDGLTLQEARDHCKNPETSSKTCTDRIDIEHTETYGPWFDGYEEE